MHSHQAETAMALRDPQHLVGCDAQAASAANPLAENHQGLGGDKGHRQEMLPPACTLALRFSELSGIGRIPCHLNVDFLANVHQRSQSKVHTIGAVDELLKLLCGDSLADFPDAEGRTFRPNGTERVVVETRF